jgi:anti-sigma factor RsiW
MSKSNHPIEQEELMAYLDGELATDRAVAAAAHLEHCAECEELAADLRKLSQEMMAWEVEAGDIEVKMPIAIAAGQDRPRALKKKRLG